MSLKFDVKSLKIKALRVVVKQDEVKALSGLKVSDKEKEAMRPNTGTVIFIDEKVEEYKVGDRVMFFDGAGFPISIALEPYKCMHWTEIIGTFED